MKTLFFSFLFDLLLITEIKAQIYNWADSSMAKRHIISNYFGYDSDPFGASLIGVNYSYKLRLPILLEAGVLFPRTKHKSGNHYLFGVQGVVFSWHNFKSLFKLKNEYLGIHSSMPT